MGLHEKIAERIETKTRKSERTRERIVEAAWELVLERRSADFQMAEVAHFFDIINNKTTNDSTPEHAYRVLKIAKGEF